MASTPAPAVAVSAWAGSTNLGDELVLAALLAKLRARGVSPVVLSIDPEGTTAVHGVTAARGREVVRRGGAPFHAVLLGGGGLLQDETSPFNLPYHLGRARLAAGKARPLAGIGLGAGPIQGAVGRRLVRRTLGRAVAVSVRDQASLEVLGRTGVAATLAADLAVSLPSPRVEVEARVAVSLRPWTGQHSRVPVGLRRGRQLATPPWFAPAMAATLDRVAAGTGLAVHFVALQGDRDDGVHREVAARMRTPATFAVPDVHTVVAEVASSAAVVAMRYHAGVAALLGGRPAVLIGYSPKVPALALDVPGGMTGLGWDPEQLARLPAALDAVVGAGGAVDEARERLRAREQGNDRVLDRLLEATLRASTSG